MLSSDVMDSKHAYVDVDACPNIECVRSRLSRCRMYWLCMLLGLLATAAISTSAVLFNNPACRTPTSKSGDSPIYLHDQKSPASYIPKTYHYFEDGLDDQDFKSADDLWEQLYPEGAGLIFLSAEYASLHNLPPSVSNPQRGNRSVYEMAGYHSMHCVSTLRFYIGVLANAQESGKKFDMDSNSRWPHLLHCIADLRQAILCQMDETLYVAKDLVHHPGQEQVRLCKNLQPINEWLEKHYRE